MNNLFGLKEAVILEIKNILFEQLSFKKSYSVSVFGSRSRGDYQLYSDLDLWIDSDPMLNSKECAHLLESFEESDVPIKVDIVTNQSCLEEYKNQISKDKKLWFKN